MSNTKNDLAWEKLFRLYQILPEIARSGSFEISAGQINQFREARLMTKFDHQANLPKIFADNQLSILPLTRGTYVISQFDAYQKFGETNQQITKVAFPAHLESIDYEQISSESIAIHCAFAGGIIADFVQDEALMPTVSGRMSSREFSFAIRNNSFKRDMSIQVANSQLEIDGGYEGAACLTLIEAKNAISDDFLIRQLYYPYRLWSGLVTKPVRNVFLVYSNGIYSLYEYVFIEPGHYNSLVLARQKCYSIAPSEFSLRDISRLLETVEVFGEPELPFPQADNFRRVINLCELLQQNDLTKDDITTNYDFDPRQTNYYTDAGRYLGLIGKKRENNAIVFYLTDEGRRLFKLRHKARQLQLAELILQHKPFYETLKRCLRFDAMPPKEEIVRSMKRSNLYKVESDSTYQRRASTIVGWVSWILDLQSC